MSLDPYVQHVEKTCADIAKNNSTIEKISSTLGLSKLTDGVKDYLDTGVIESVKESPLRVLGEDILAQTINENSRRVSQNVTNVVKKAIPGKVVNTLQDVRSLAFDAVTTVITFKNDMVLFFASQVAEQAIKAIREKRRVLLGLQEAVRKLHNALLVLTGGGPFFNKYLADLRLALVKIAEARKNVDMVYSSFYSTLKFPQTNFNTAKTLLDQAYDLIMPPITGAAAEELKEGFLKNAFVGPKYEEQLAMIMAIPKLAWEMLKAYDLYVLRVLKVNVLLLAFQNCVQNLQSVTGGAFKKRILDLLEQEQIMLTDLIENMALQLNGDIGAYYNPINIEYGRRVDSSGVVTFSGTKKYEPNPTKTSARAISWSVRAKAARALLELLDPGALQNLSLSNAALRQYNKALADLETKDERRTALAILRATDGREQLGDIEADLITFAFQANQAIVDSALTRKEDGRFNEKSVISLGAKLNSRLQLSIDQDREIEDILLRFVAATGPLLDSVRSLGNSLFRVLDDLGLDKASETLRGGAFGDFFAMTSKTATYVGGAMAGLALVQNLLADESQKQCLQRAIDTLQAEAKSKELAASRSTLTNYARQQEVNNKICDNKKKEQAQVELCSSQIDLNQLKANPTKSLSGMFSGVFGGAVSDSLPFTGGLFASTGTSALSINEATKASTQATNKAKLEMSAAINKVPGFTADPNDSLDTLKKKASEASKMVEGPAKEALDNAGITTKVSEMVENNAKDVIKSATSSKDIFQSLPSQLDGGSKEFISNLMPQAKGILS